MLVRTPLLVAAALLSGVLLPATAPAAADTGPVPLASSTLGRIVLDEERGHLFLSAGPTGAGVQVTDLQGATVARLDELAGATGMALTPDGAGLWVALPKTGLARIDTGTLTVDRRITLPTGHCAGEVAVVGTRLVYGHSCNTYGGSGGYGGIGLVDVTTGAVLGSVSKGPYYRPVLAAGPAGQVYAADAGLSPATLYLYDVRGASPVELTSRWNVCSNLRDLSASPDGAQVVTACGSPYSHDVFSAPDLASAGTYPSGDYPLAGAWSSDGSTFAAGTDSAHGPDVRVYRAGSATPTRTVDFGSSSQLLQPRGLAVSRDGSRTWAVAGTTGGGLTLRVLDAVPPAPAPSSLGLAADPPEFFVGFGTTVGGYLGSGGQALAGRTLTVYRSTTGTAGSQLRTVTTGADGTFRFPDTPPAAGSYTYTVVFAGDSAASRVQATTDVVVRPATSTSIDLGLSAGTAAGSVRGTVQLRSPEPAALAGRSIGLSRVSGSTTTWLAWPTTDSAGTATFTDTPGSGTHTYLAYLMASPSTGEAETKTSATITVPVPTTTLTATVDAGTGLAGDPVTVRGTLTSGTTIVSGATVSVTRSGCSTAGWTSTAVTTPNGAWSVTDPAAPAGTCTYRASYAGDATSPAAATSTSTTVTLRETSLALSVVRGSGSAKKEVVVTGQLGATSTNRRLTLTAQPARGAEVVLVSAGLVDADGRLSVRYTPKTTTTYRVTFSGDAWYAPRTVERTQ